MVVVGLGNAVPTLALLVGVTAVLDGVDPFGFLTGAIYKINKVNFWGDAVIIIVIVLMKYSQKCKSSCMYAKVL